MNSMLMPASPDIVKSNAPVLLSAEQFARVDRAQRDVQDRRQDRKAAQHALHSATLKERDAGERLRVLMDELYGPVP